MFELINIIISILEKLIPAFRKVAVSISNIEMQLDLPAEIDGRGGFIHGSRGEFTLEIINYKSQNVFIENVHCGIYRNELLIQNNVPCYDKSTMKKIAMAPTYLEVRTISVPARDHKKIQIRISSNQNLKSCNRVVLFYSIGHEQYEKEIYKMQEDTTNA